MQARECGTGKINPAFAINYISDIYVDFNKTVENIIMYDPLVRPHLEYAMPANCSYLKRDTHHLERIQWAATRHVKDLRGLTYEQA